MKVIITGGCGFIGSHIVDKLLANNFEVVIIDNLSKGMLKNVPQINDVTFYQLDITNDDLEPVFQKEKPDFFVHFAAQTSVVCSTEDPYYDAKVNIMASINILNLCKKYNIKKAIFASSAAVYGMPKNLPIDESHLTDPISHYGLSKLTMEKYAQLSGIPYLIFRLANVYGPRQATSQESGVVAIFNDKMLKNEDIYIYGDGEQIRDFVYVEDIADTISKAIESNIANEIINFSTNTGISINELFVKMSKIYGYSKKPIYKPAREGDIQDSILSNHKVHDLFKTFSSTKLEIGLNNLKNSSVGKEE